MKLFVFCLFVVANISNNGKASLESFAPTSDTNYLIDTTQKSDKSCHRPCKFNVKPRRCYYSFDVEPTMEDGRPVLSINGETPGPPIHVCLHDIIIVQVKNKIPDQDLAIHWHGVDQRGTPYMDGVPMITQCPVSYGSTFKYAFKASSPGTFFYHADSVAHQSDGVYGSLIVDQPQPMQAHSALYDYDRSQEHTLVIGAKFPELLTANLDAAKQKPNSLVINGDSTDTKLFVMQSYGYRLRLINAIAVECPILISINEHPMTVVAADGKPVQPVLADTVKLYPGERLDVVVRADKITGGYWLRVKGESECQRLEARAMLLYTGFNYTAMLGEQPSHELNYDTNNIITGQKLLSYKDVNLAPKIKSVYLGIERNNINVKDEEIDYRYMSDVLPKKPLYPSVLSTAEGVVQINGKNFIYPNAPLLLRPRDVFKHIACDVGDEAKSIEVQCLQTLKANMNEPLELILVNEGFNTNDSYTFHLHGLSMHVVATWYSPAGLPMSKKEFEKLDKEGRIERNLLNPPMKDTITVPNKGFTIVRINPDHGGSWLLECRSCSLTLPAALLINVPISIPKAVVDSLPSCGSYKPADVLLN